MGNDFFDFAAVFAAIIQLVAPIVIGLIRRKEVTKVVKATRISIEINIEMTNTRKSPKRKS
jgi:hypothetical protein